MIKTDRLTDTFDVASPLLLLQLGSKTCLFCDLDITSKEARNNISVSMMETLKKPSGKPSSYAKNYELVWGKIKDLDTQCYVVSCGQLMLHVVAILIIQKNLKKIRTIRTNNK